MVDERHLWTELSLLVWWHGLLRTASGGETLEWGKVSGIETEELAEAGLSPTVFFLFRYIMRLALYENQIP